MKNNNIQFWVIVIIIALVAGVIGAIVAGKITGNAIWAYGSKSPYNSNYKQVYTAQEVYNKTEVDAKLNSYCLKLYFLYSSSFHYNCNDREYNRIADFNKDGKISSADFAIFSLNYNNEDWCNEQLAKKENPCTAHSADINKDWKINATEYNRILAYNRAGEYHVDATGQDGYAPGAGSHNGNYHTADYNKDWKIDDTEKLRVDSYWKDTSGYVMDPLGLDGFAPCSTCPNGCEKGACK